MRKLAIFAVTTFVLGIAAVAYAQVTNTYTVDASTSPTRKGKPKRPVPVQVNFDFQVGEESGQRPGVIQKYSIRFNGLRVNTNRFPSCTAAQLQARGPQGCRRARIGGGFVQNAAGARDNQSDTSITCNLQLTLFNTRNNRALLLLEGGPNETDTRRQCPLEFGSSNGSGIIQANFIRSRLGVALEFSVPDNLRHPLPTLSNAVTEVTSRIDRKTRRIKRKRVGYFESIGGCRNRRRTVTVTFTPESGGGSSRRASTTAACR